MSKTFYAMFYLAIIFCVLLYTYTLSKVLGYEAVIYVVPVADINLNDYALKTDKRFTAVYIQPGAETGFCVLNNDGNYCAYVTGTGDYLYVDDNTHFEDVTFFLSRFVLRPLLYHIFHRIHVGPTELQMPV